MNDVLHLRPILQRAFHEYKQPCPPPKELRKADFVLSKVLSDSGKFLKREIRAFTWEIS